jgi:hypothetical protein
VHRLLINQMQAMEPGRREFARRAAEMQGLIDKGNLAALLQRATSDSFTFGPAGSGEQLRQEQVDDFFFSGSFFFLTLTPSPLTRRQSEQFRQAGR